MLIPETEKFAEQMGMNPDELLRRALIAFVRQRLQETLAETAFLQQKYGIQTLADFDGLYERGEVEEAGTWRDIQRFDRLAYQQEVCEGFLKYLMDDEKP